MIVLHLGNGYLENVIASNGFGAVANNRNRIFDAFTSFDLQEIFQVVSDTCKSKYDIKPAGRYILKIVHDLLGYNNHRPFFLNFANCPFPKLPERILAKLSSGQLTQTAADNFNSLFMMGQSECAKIDTFFYDMKAQMSHIATNNANNTGGASVLSAIKKGQLLCIDLNSSANIMLLELIVNTLIIAMSRGYEFTLFLDDVGVANNEPFKNMICQKSSHNNVVCSKDLFALLSGKDDVFSSVTGEMDKTVLLSHRSHISCERWSKFIGEYDKIDVSQNRNAGFSQGSKWGYSSNYGKTMTDKREHKVKPDQINRLTPNEIFIYDHRTGSLIQANVV